MNEFKSNLDFSIQQLDRHFDSFPAIIRYLDSEGEKDQIYIEGAASHIAAYYDGIEKIFSMINRHTDGINFNPSRSHSELLFCMKSKTENRDAVISEDIYEELKDIMDFRHFFRHSYSFLIDEERLKTVLYKIPDNWPKTKRQIQEFEEKISHRFK